MPSVRLTWSGREAPAPLPGPAVLAPVHRFPGEGTPNRLVLGDNLAVLVALREELAGRVDLVTIDPPYSTGAERTARGGRYKDAWGGLAGYLAMMEPRLRLLWELLAPTGVLIVQSDHRAHPYLRVLLDELFGADRLVNDIVWSYRSGGGTKRRFGAKHDNLAVYAKSEAFHFNPDAVRVPYDASIAAKRAHLFHPAGKVPGDVWEISRPPNHAEEWTGYPTQKPVELLAFQIRAFTPEDGLVLDAFCGSGTTAVAAAGLGRRWIGIDENPRAVHVARTRLATLAEARPFDVLYDAANAPESGGTLAARVTDAAVELTGYEPGGLEAVETWSVEVNGTGGIFTHDWCAERPKKGAMIAHRSPALPLVPGSRIRVFAADREGRETIAAVNV
ncbi:MAG: hypothetical protein PWP23_3190 [Candidatus Sumerlaeota bacterium]|nr:hypothetical protein [Candidatus Sumerlaeota bacterium]